MKFSKHVETCFVRANDDFDDKLTYIYCFLNEKKLLDKNPQKRTLCSTELGLQVRGQALQVEVFVSYSAQILQVENGLKLVS